MRQMRTTSSPTPLQAVPRIPPVCIHQGFPMSDTVTATAAEFDLRARAIYDLGNSTIYASRSDPRFSYCTYVPPHIGSAGSRPMQLVVVMHGTGRAFTEYRDAFAEFAKWNDCIVLCPLFPPARKATAT